MRKLFKLKVIILLFSIIFTSYSSAADRILPLARPIPVAEVKKETAKKKQIVPEKKPETIKEIEKTEQSLETVESTEEQKEIFIYPEKKPLLVKTKIQLLLAGSTAHRLQSQIQ